MRLCEQDLAIKEATAPQIYRCIPARIPCVSAAEHHALPGTHPGSEDTSHTTIVARSQKVGLL
jgi:hypothetical protein